MSTLCIRHPGSIERCTQGWAISFVIHGVLVGLFIALVTSLHMPSDPNAFRWEVALVETPEPAAAAAARTEPSPSRSDSKRSEKTSAVIPPDRRVAVETTRTVTPVKQVEMVRAIESVQPTETVQMVHKAQPLSRPEMKTISPLPQKTLSTTLQPLQQAASVDSQPVQAAEAVVYGVVAMAPNATVQSHAKTREAPSAQEQSVVSTASRAFERQVVTQTQPVASTPTSESEQVRVETKTLATRPLIEARLSPIPDTPPSPGALQPPTTQPSGQPTRKLPSVSLSTPRSSSNNAKTGIQKRTRSDLAWLQEKLDQAMKKTIYFQDVKKKIRGQVFFEIHQERDKVLLDDVQIYESSGQVMIDREVLKRFKAVFPITLEESMEPARQNFILPYDVCINATSCADIAF